MCPPGVDATSGHRLEVSNHAPRRNLCQRVGEERAAREQAVVTKHAAVIPVGLDAFEASRTGRSIGVPHFLLKPVLRLALEVQKFQSFPQELELFSSETDKLL